MKILESEGRRDQSPSVFTGILVRLCRASGALAAAFVDSEGETVDYAGRVEPYDLRVAAAEWRLVLALLQAAGEDRARAWAHANEIVIRARGRSFAVWALSDGYALVLVLPRHSFRISRRALAQTADELEGEAGIRYGGERERLRWWFVEVQTAASDPRRPEAVWHEGAWCAITILGRLERHDLDASEIGYMARFLNGRELLLVREPLGRWFAGDPL